MNLDELFEERSDAPVVENENGGRQSKLEFDYSLFPWDALLLVNQILVLGAAKYGVDNWRKIDWKDHWNHALQHLVAALMHPKQRLLHLQHAGCRVLFALACAASGER